MLQKITTEQLSCFCGGFSWIEQTSLFPIDNYGACSLANFFVKCLARGGMGFEWIWGKDPGLAYLQHAVAQVRRD